MLNEEEYILDCLVSVKNFKNSYHSILTIYVVDGGSSDKTTEIVNEFVSDNKNFVLLHNEKRTQPAAMNLVINEFKGDFLMRLDAHCLYPEDYLDKCIETSLRTNAENSGGVLITLPGGNNLGAKNVQALTSHWFGVGNSGFRIGVEEGEVDTVPFGFFSKTAINRNKFFDEELIRGQDYEYNRRIINNGGKIWLNPNIRAKYYNQKYFFSFIKKLMLLDGPYNAYMWSKYPYTLSFRHLITPLFFLGNVAGIILFLYSNFLWKIYLMVMIIYFVLAIKSSFDIFKTTKQLNQILVLPACFFLMHLFYGAGAVFGMIMLITGLAPISITNKAN